MIKNYTRLSFALLMSVITAESLCASNSRAPVSLRSYRHQLEHNLMVPDSVNTDTIGQMIKSLQRFSQVRDTVFLQSISLVPNLSVQQMIKGNLAGVYVQEPSGEPGTMQSMIVHGASGPMFSKRDFYALQPAIYLNGVPMVQDNPFAFDIQKYDYNRIGPATNLLAQIDVSNIQSITVVKDPYELAKLGPNAANGAIYITTKNARAGRNEISVNSYFGFAAAPKVYTVNGVHENNFRKPFYEKYAGTEQYASYAPYLRDSTNTDYFGPSDWNDLYYKTTPTYSADLGLTGGNERANFRFFGAATRNAGNADKTSLNRYNINFGINMAPYTWLTVSSNVNAVRMDRQRNRSLRDRFAEARYIPDLGSPLSPNAAVFSSFLAENERNVDGNRVTALNGNLTLAARLKGISLTSSLLFDYNEGTRHYFTPSTLMDGVSYISDYFGYNQRMIWNNAAGYKLELDDSQFLDFEIGHTYQGDTYKYNYSQAYNGPNNFVKLNKVNPAVNSSNYLNSADFYIFRFIDKELSNLLSFYGSVRYRYKDLLSLSALIRRDGASNGQPDSRWVTTPAFHLSYSLKEHFFSDRGEIQTLNITTGWGRTVRVFQDDRYAAGPQYRQESGWFEEPTIPGYGPSNGMNRPYTSGFIGYGIQLPIAERSTLGLEGSFFQDRLHAGISIYRRRDLNQLVAMPVAQETGYTVEHKSGLAIDNKGLDLLLSGNIIQSGAGFRWASGLNLNYNQNKVSALPDGYHELILGDNKLEVGKSVGSYWLYTNTGIYGQQSEIPTGRTFHGIPIQFGDPIWKDFNEDNRIDSKDKVLTGDRLPAWVGGWNNTISYKNVDLNFNFIFAVGHKSLNQYEAIRYGFIRQENSSDITAVKEVSSWQIHERQKSYPIYNPWSDVDPYRVDQDLFLEDASYAKLRSVTLGYDFRKAKGLFKSNTSLRRLYVYATATNLWTISKFSGVDPEMVNFNGYYDGANLTIPKTFVLGFKLDL